MSKLKLAKSVFDISKLDSYHYWFFIFQRAELRVRFDATYFGKYWKQVDSKERLIREAC
jgi:hypothetical protein